MRVQDVNILIVDDVNAIRVQIKELLKKAGFEKIRVVGNGLEALKALEAEEFHLILSDWQMTPLDGLELLKFVRNHPTYKAISFLMVTAEGTREKVLQAVECGCDGYLIKPVTVEQIQKQVFAVILKKGVLS
ncbi:MAG: response regulator [Bacteriovoracia bacterium]